MLFVLVFNLNKQSLACSCHLAHDWVSWLPDLRRRALKIMSGDGIYQIGILTKQLHTTAKLWKSAELNVKLIKHYLDLPSFYVFRADPVPHPKNYGIFGQSFATITSGSHFFANLPLVILGINKIPTKNSKSRGSPGQNVLCPLHWHQ
ncbi:hypothetical protein LPB72_06070 [Hydrogenophaga crassostreae]|uniref:Uncharacterized protein n=1 Tax=Hydrogenophaga crassostreae TaxID=1763535 RepID=A0A167IK79_9BURK|nr:hypothetical protein LPB072_18480 [Hydrogenophaga crassostreae]OAD43065.1 hypothetical protein LPB72_06070 [Hydrogenophaga crassostreae]